MLPVFIPVTVGPKKAVPGAEQLFKNNIEKLIIKIFIKMETIVLLVHDSQIKKIYLFFKIKILKNIYT